MVLPYLCMIFASAFGRPEKIEKEEAVYRELLEQMKTYEKKLSMMIISLIFLMFLRWY